MKERGNCFIPHSQGYFNVWGLICYDGSGLMFSRNAASSRLIDDVTETVSFGGIEIIR